MKFAVIPNALRDAIQLKLTEQIKIHPDAEKDRDVLYHKLLNFYDLHGYIPDFTLKKGETS